MSDKTRLPHPTITTATTDSSARSPYLTTLEAAAFLRVSKSYLDKARVYGNGPRFVRLGERKVVYHAADLDAWVAERQYASTSEYQDAVPSGNE